MAEAGAVAEAGVVASESTAATVPHATGATAGADISARIIDRRSRPHDPNRTKIRCAGQSGAPDFIFG